MFKKILIANRGEIACRIMRTAKQLGIQTVAVYSAADKQALHVKMADEAYYIGPAPSSESYLKSKEIIKVALASHAEAIHPGYGFLSENADFVEACQAANLRFIGPSPDAIRKMGEKNTAKHIMETAGVPVVPGYHGSNQDATFLKKMACEMGFPVLIKAVAGGGGKGMRVVEREEEFEKALLAAKSEAKTSFGDDMVLLEKYLTQTRHVELQVFADSHGNAVYLFERDCSLQRRHQKVLEEAPAPGMTKALRQAMGAAAVNAARAINYEGAGTVEFLLAPALNNAFYFMEMNTRLQVEHPVTEKITGLDLVEWQLQVANGAPLPLSNQSEINLNGHAIEARIYAENPEKEFTPSTGRLAYFHLPEQNQHVRIDTGVTEGDEISIYYDPLIAKLIVWDEDRNKAITCLKKALAEFHVAGVNTNISLLTAISKNRAFIHAELDTHFIKKQHVALLPENKPMPHQAIALAAMVAILTQRKLNLQLRCRTVDAYSPWFSDNAWKLNLPSIRHIHLKTQASDIHVSAQMKHDATVQSLVIENTCYALSECCVGDHRLSILLDTQAVSAAYAVLSSEIHLFFQGEQFAFKMVATDHDEESAETSDRITAPMPGTVVDISVIPGQEVKKGQRLVVIEAMKMQHTLYAPDNGMIKDVLFNTGDLIEEGTEVILWEGQHA